MYTMRDIVVYILIAALVYFFLLPIVVAMLDSPSKEGFAVIKPIEKLTKSSWNAFKRALKHLWRDIKSLFDRFKRDIHKL